jgi:hypothetical protein
LGRKSADSDITTEAIRKKKADVPCVGLSFCQDTLATDDFSSHYLAALVSLPDGFSGGRAGVPSAFT